MFDKKKLKEILSVQSKSNDDKLMMDFLVKELQRIHKVSPLSVSTDEYGNIYIIKGTADLYPCVVAHTDTVHNVRKKFQVVEIDGAMFAWDSDKCEQAGIGGDDKVGIYMCIQALYDIDVVKVVFFRNEEIGCLGSKKAHMEFFEDCSMVLQADRKGAKDFIDYSNGVDLYGKEFKEATKEIIEFYGYDFCRGIATDVGQLKNNKIECAVANVSCGYYNAHSDREYVVISEVETCYKLFLTLFSELGNQRWVHKYEPPVYNNYASSYGGGGNSYYNRQPTGNNIPPSYTPRQPSAEGHKYTEQGSYDYEANGYEKVPIGDKGNYYWRHVSENGTRAVFGDADPNPMNETQGCKKKVQTIQTGTQTTLSESSQESQVDSGGEIDDSHDIYGEVDYRIAKTKWDQGLSFCGVCPDCGQQNDFYEQSFGDIMCDMCYHTFNERDIEGGVSYKKVIDQYEKKNGVDDWKGAPKHYCSCTMMGVSEQEFMSCCRWCDSDWYHN